MRLSPGDTFDRYVIESLLGEGGMGEVYQARDVRLERRVALKVLRREAAEDPEAWNRALVRMLREARAAAALNHPNTVAIYDIGDASGQPYLAMELIEGESLRRLLGSGASVTTKLGWLCDVARALSAAHRAGLVHRDVKPENVMLRSDGMIKVLDFGIARRVQFDVDEVASTQRGVAAPTTSPTGNRISVLPGSTDTVTGEGVMVGTPAYMAPEQLRGEPVDARTDQFGWGVLAYELLSGKVPFGAGLEGVRLLSAILSDEPPSLDGIVPPVIERILKRTVAKKKADRLASMDYVLEALAPHVAPDSVSALQDMLIGTPDSTAPEGGDVPETFVLRKHTTRPPPAVMEEPPDTPRTPRSPGAKSTPTHTKRSPDLDKGARNTPPPPTPVVRIEKAGSKVGAAATTLESPAVMASRPVSPPRGRPRWFFAFVGVAAIWVAAAMIWAYWFVRPDPTPQPVASAAPLPAPTAITDLPLPISASPEALAAYKEGLQALRDASWEVARAAFERASKLDPSLGASYLRLAMIDRFRRDTASTLGAFQRAMQLKATLSPRDRVLLNAFEPIMQRDPPDFAETIALIEAASREYPEDAELVYLRILLNTKSEPAALLALSERCIEIDPKYADCLQARSFFLARLGREQEALSALDRCVEAAPSALDCLLERINMYKYLGRCDRLEADARRWLTKDQGSPLAYRELAVALAAQGAAPVAVGVAVDQAARRFKEAGRVEESEDLRIDLAVLSGDFEAAEKLAEAFEQSIAEESLEEKHVVAARALVQLYRETEQDKRAAEVADRFLTQRAAWTRPVHRTSWWDVTVPFLEAKHAGGLLDDGAYESARDAWVSGWSKETQEIDRAAIWLNGYAVAARNEHDARKAFALEPTLRPAIYYSSQHAVTVEELVGGVDFLAGEYDRAEPHLERASRSCIALDEPIRHTVATYRAGVVREAKNDKAGACAAYRIVLSRWGRAKRSATARSAAQRAKALKCDE